MKMRSLNSRLIPILMGMIVLTFSFRSLGQERIVNGQVRTGQNGAALSKSEGQSDQALKNTILKGIKGRGIPMRSGGSYESSRKLYSGTLPDPILELKKRTEAGPIETKAVTTSFDGFNFVDNITQTGGWMFIPPDPIGAAGPDRLIAVGNVVIEARDKTGTLLWIDALRDFFSILSPAGFLFDPKIVYDHYANRFVVVALDKNMEGTNPNPSNSSHIFVAVSKTGSPASATSDDWYFHSIDSKETIGGFDHWMDYPGLEIDEEVVYITGHMFAHTGGSTNYRVRLWIVDKGLSGGFYGGGAATVNIYDPYALSGATGYESTTMPALVYDGTGAIASFGTWLVSYSGLTSGGDGGSEFILAIYVANPLGVITFTSYLVNIGDIENIGGAYGWPSLADAPQSETATTIEVNDRRALDAVWRDNHLWLTTTINPNTGDDAGQTTAHWIKLDATDSAVSPTLDDQGNIGGEDIHASGNVYTFFPSVAVNGSGDAYFGFSASSANIYPGAYAAGRPAGSAAGFVGESETVHAGEDYYQRTFGTWPADRNRWGDYTGMAVDPTDDNLFWAFNQYAMTRGNGTAPEDGRWGTTWASLTSVFEIESHTPLMNARNINANNNIQFTFSNNVDGSSLNANTTFNVDGSISGEHLGSFSGGGGTTITFDPTHNFEPGEIVTVTLTTGVQSTHGVALDNPFTYQFTVTSTSASGTFGVEQSVSTNADGASYVIAADIDGDGDLDAISASENDNVIAWYENDGTPNWNRNEISAAATGANCVHAADIDGDGDLDVLSASTADDKIAWYENGNSWNPTSITTSADEAKSVFAADIDGDGDLDVLSASTADDKIAWYENGNSWNPTSITTSADEAKSVFAADIDGDGDLDVLSASTADDKIAWYANSNNGTSWSETSITTGANGAESVFAADIDGDGDLDVLSASSLDDKVAWYENGNTWNATPITTSADEAKSVFAADIDGDGDLDVLSASSADDKVAWYDNGWSPVITDLTITGGTNLKLTWDVVAGATGYNVYRGTAVNFVPDKAGGSNRIGSNVSDEDLGSAGVQWTDGADVVGDPVTNYFYGITALGSEGDMSTVWGEFDFSLVTTATTDFNEIALAMNIDGVTTAEALMNAIPNCNSVARWSASIQGYDQFIPGIPATNFAVEAGYPYYVNVTADVVYSMVGSAASPTFNLITTATTDFNEVMLTLDKTDIDKASELMADITNCNSVARWDASLQGYEQYIPGIPATDFDVRVGYPYYVNVTANTTWPSTGAPKMNINLNPNHMIASGDGSDAPHAVWGRFESTLSPITHFSAFIRSRPGERLTEKSAGSFINGNVWLVQVSAFPSRWRIGDILVVEFNDDAGNTASTQVELTENPDDQALNTMMVNTAQIPQEYNVSQNYPNPFNPVTTIAYQIPKAGTVKLAVYSMTGQLVRTLLDEEKKAGYYHVLWDGKDKHGQGVSSGLYVYVIQCGDFVKRMKAVFMK